MNSFIYELEVSCVFGWRLNNIDVSIDSTTYQTADLYAGTTECNRSLKLLTNAINETKRIEIYGYRSLVVVANTEYGVLKHRLSILTDYARFRLCNFTKVIRRIFMVNKMYVDKMTIRRPIEFLAHAIHAKPWKCPRDSNLTWKIQSPSTSSGFEFYRK